MISSVFTLPEKLTLGSSLRSVMKAGQMRSSVSMNMVPKDPSAPGRVTANSPASRMERFAALQKRAFALLAASPQGYRRFWLRNLRNRRINASF